MKIIYTIGMIALLAVATVTAAIWYVFSQSVRFFRKH